MSVATAAGPAPFNCFDPVYRGWRRYDALAPFRESELPLAVDPLGRTWLFRYEDAWTTLTNTDELEAQETAVAVALGFEEGCPFHRFQQHAMISQNPPKHTRLRKAQQYFGKHQLKAMRPTIHEACDSLVDAFPDDGVVEFSYEFAFKLPVGVIMRMLRLPAEDEDTIRALSPRVLPSGTDPEMLRATDDANAQMTEYVERVMADRRKHPVEGEPISEMLAAERRGELHAEEIPAQIVSLIVAGHETTTCALSLLLYTLLHNRDQLEDLRADRSLIGNAAYEILRFEPPLDHVPRRVRLPWEMHGKVFEVGEMVVPSLSAANRDPRQFADPDRFDIRRSNALRHLAFGAGMHRCLGASLAALELQVALEVLLERLETVELGGEPELATTGVFRAFASLPLHVKRRS